MCWLRFLWFQHAYYMKKKVRMDMNTVISENPARVFVILVDLLSNAKLGFWYLRAVNKQFF